MANLRTNTKMSSSRPGQLLSTNLTTTDPFKPQALTDYEKKKEEEHKRIHAEIKRVSLSADLV